MRTARTLTAVALALLVSSVGGEERIATLHWRAVCDGWTLIGLDITVNGPGRFAVLLDWRSVCQGA